MIRQAAWLVDVAANHHLVPMHCLVRSLALAWMLARRGCSTELKLGVRRDDGQFAFRAWVEWRGQTVNDAGRPRDHYALIEPTASQRMPIGDLSNG